MLGWVLVKGEYIVIIFGIVNIVYFEENIVCVDWVFDVVMIVKVDVLINY